jgi:hypothetical protein
MPHDAAGVLAGAGLLGRGLVQRAAQQQRDHAVMAPITNGMRQPQAFSSASSSSCCSTTITSTASSWPPISVTYWNDEKKPRWPRIATSLM